MPTTASTVPTSHANTAYGGSSGPGDVLGAIGDVAGNTWSGAVGSFKFVDSILKVFTNNSPSKEDFNVAVITIVIFGLLLAIVLTNAGSVTKVVSAVR